MKKYVVFKNPRTGNIEVVKPGYSFAAAVLTLLQLGWIWAFAKGAPDFGWRLLAATVIATVICYNVPLLAIFWLPFAASVGNLANKQLVLALKKRGFNQVAEVDAAGADQALSAAPTG